MKNLFKRKKVEQSNTEKYDTPTKIAIKKFKKDKTAMSGLIIFVIIILLAFVVTLFIADPNYFGWKPEEIAATKNLKPFTNGYLLGTDNFGRDLFSRLLNGTKTTMIIAFSATIVASLIGIIVGGIAGYFGGWIDAVISRLIEVFVSIPFLVFAIVVSSIAFELGKTSTSEQMNLLIIIFIVFGWMPMARLIRGQVKQIRSSDYVNATKSLGIPTKSTIGKHIIPGMLHFIVVRFTLALAVVALSEVTLSALGVGIKGEDATLGNLISSVSNTSDLALYWWYWVPAAIMIFLLIVSVNLIGDGIRNAFDSKRGD